MWFKFRFAVVKYTFWLVMRLQVYNAWSHLYRALAERDRAPLRNFAYLSDLVVYIRTLKWRPDTWRQLWDAVSHPFHVQWLALFEPQKLVGDCDDFAAYIIEVLTRMFRMASWKGRLMSKFEFLTVRWWKPEGGFGGHNVALIESEDGLFAWMDYDFPSDWFESTDACVEDIMKKYAEDGKLVGSARSRRDLWCHEVKLA